MRLREGLAGLRRACTPLGGSAACWVVRQGERGYRGLISLPSAPPSSATPPSASGTVPGAPLRGIRKSSPLVLPCRRFNSFLAESPARRAAASRIPLRSAPGRASSFGRLRCGRLRCLFGIVAGGTWYLYAVSFSVCGLFVRVFTSFFPSRYSLHFRPLRRASLRSGSPETGSHAPPLCVPGDLRAGRSGLRERGRRARRSPESLHSARRLRCLSGSAAGENAGTAAYLAAFRSRSALLPAGKQLFWCCGREALRASFSPPSLLCARPRGCGRIGWPKGPSRFLWPRSSAKRLRFVPWAGACASAAPGPVAAPSCPPSAGIGVWYFLPFALFF